MTPYSSLTPIQQAQAQMDLFHDALFGVDSGEFDYVLQDGIVTGRIPLTLEKIRKPIRNQPVIIYGTQASAITDADHYRLDCAINDLARAVALSLASKEIEVNA